MSAMTALVDHLQYTKLYTFTIEFNTKGAASIQISGTEVNARAVVSAISNGSIISHGQLVASSM